MNEKVTDYIRFNHKKEFFFVIKSYIILFCDLINNTRTLNGIKCFVLGKRPLRTFSEF